MSKTPATTKAGEPFARRDVEVGMLRTRIKIGIVAAVVAACSSFAMAPAQASACHPDPLGPDVSGEEQICYTVMRVLCAPFEKLGGCPIR